jgi:predicted MFS family arabinose efflux permease
LDFATLPRTGRFDALRGTPSCAHQNPQERPPPTSSSESSGGSGISLAGLCVCFLVLRIALHTGVLVDLAFGLASAVAQLFFPAQQVGLANDFPGRRATVLAWNNSALFLGISLGSLIGGEAISHGSFEVNLTISASIAISGWMINWAVMPNPARPRWTA